MSWYTDNLGPMYIQPPSFNDYIKEEMDLIPLKKKFDKLTIKYKIDLKKETEKMEAKKCDRCGKLYEMPGEKENEGADVRFKHMYVYGAEDMSGNKIAEKQTKRIWIKGVDCGTVDLCPECRKSLKKWFESTDKEEKKNV